MKHLILQLLLLCPIGLQAQSRTDQVVDSIMNHLLMNSLDGYAIVESNGRNHATRGEFTIDNRPIEATTKLIRGLRPWLDQLPHLRRMTDESAGETLNGRIAMRLKPEAGDTSAYFLMTYNRTKLTFKYGVNSPGSISLTKSPANGPGVGYDHKELSATEASPVTRLFEDYSQRLGARVIDTLFQYDGDKDYEIWMGYSDERSQTKARIVLLPSPTDREISQWWNVVKRYDKHNDVTISRRNSVSHGKPILTSVSCTFTTAGAYHLYLAAHYREQLCLIRVVTQPGEQRITIPGFVRLIDHLMGTEQPSASLVGTPDKLIALMEKELSRRQSLPDAQVIDTLFVSNDREGHIWWQNMNHRCPTRTHIVRTSSSEKDFDGLHQRIRQAIVPMVHYQAWTDKVGDDRCIILNWQDERGCYHAYIIYYIIATRQLIVERADGEAPNSICIPHYHQEWFEQTERIINEPVHYIPGGTFCDMPRLRRLVFNGLVGHIDAGAIQNNPELREIVFNGPVFSTGGPQLCQNCPKLERVVFNNIVGNTYFGEPYNSPQFKGYETNGIVLYSQFKELIPQSDLTKLTKSERASIMQLEQTARQWMSDSVEVDDFLKRFVVNGTIYNMACSYSLAHQKEDAMRLLQLSIDAGYEDYGNMKQDTDFDFIRQDKRFQKMLQSIRGKGDKLYILQQSAPYATDDKSIKFTYASPEEPGLKRVREYFHLDSIAGTGDEVSQMKNILYWLHDAIRHDGQNGIASERRNSIDIYEACRAKGVGTNCRGLAIILSELYLAMGWPSRFVTCESKAYDTDSDCHVITMVWSRQLGKWLWMDPTFAAYVSDENGQLLSIAEVRQRLIDGLPLVLNADANWNHENTQAKEYYLESYMAKNLYVLSCWQHSTFETEGTGLGQRSIALIPPGFTYHGNQSVTTDDRQFFAAPE